MATAKKSTKKKPMSSEHKAALARGREHGRAVKNYLEALSANKPKRGRKRTPDSINKRLVGSEIVEFDHLLVETRFKVAFLI